MIVVDVVGGGNDGGVVVGGVVVGGVVVGGGACSVVIVYVVIIFISTGDAVVFVITVTVIDGCHRAVVVAISGVNIGAVVGAIDTGAVIKSLIVVGINRIVNLGYSIIATAAMFSCCFIY